MSDLDLNRLFDQTANHSLDGLEARIWRGVEKRESDYLTSRKTAAYQAAILVLAVTVITIMGVDAVGRFREGLDMKSGALHTPSHLLFGVPR